MIRPSSLDIRYATTNNFTGAVFYNQARASDATTGRRGSCACQCEVERWGLGLLVHDAYRPWHVTKMFWDATPGAMKDFVANPANGSRHNRGCAVDLTLYDLRTGEPIEMVAGYDEFSTRSFPLYPGGTSRQRWYRDLLRRNMEAEEFTDLRVRVVALRLQGLEIVSNRKRHIRTTTVGLFRQHTDVCDVPHAAVLVLSVSGARNRIVGAESRTSIHHLAAWPASGTRVDREFRLRCMC